MSEEASRKLLSSKAVTTNTPNYFTVHHPFQKSTETKQRQKVHFIKPKPQTDFIFPIPKIIILFLIQLLSLTKMPKYVFLSLKLKNGQISFFGILFYSEPIIYKLVYSLKIKIAFNLQFKTIWFSLFKQNESWLNYLLST